MPTGHHDPTIRAAWGHRVNVEMSGKKPEKQLTSLFPGQRIELLVCKISPGRRVRCPRREASGLDLPILTFQNPGNDK